jgi:hypothetical protein
MYFFDHKLTPAGFIFVIRAPPCPPVPYSGGVPNLAPRFITARHVRSSLNPFVSARRCGRFTADCATIPSFIVKEKLAAINTFQELTLTHVAAYIRPRIHSVAAQNSQSCRTHLSSCSQADQSSALQACRSPGACPIGACLPRARQADPVRPHPYVGMSLRMSPHIVARDVFRHLDARQLDDAAFDGIHERDVAHRPGEQSAFGVAGATKEIWRRGQVNDRLMPSLRFTASRPKIQRPPPCCSFRPPSFRRLSGLHHPGLSAFPGSSGAPRH